MATKTKKKVKRKKVEPKPKIRRRLLALWSKKCLTAHDYTCMVCGVKKAEAGTEPDGITTVKKIDCHHIVGKESRNSFLKFHRRNAAWVCPKCHKFGNNSAHRNAVFFINFIQTHRPEDWRFLLESHEIRIDLENRDVLYEIEDRLNADENLCLDTIRGIEEIADAKDKEESKKDETTIFEDFDVLNEEPTEPTETNQNCTD